MHYKLIEGAPEYLRLLNLKAVHVPRQDGYREHLALLRSSDDSVEFATNSLDSLVQEAERRKKKLL